MMVESEELISLLNHLEADGEPVEALQYTYYDRSELIQHSVSSGMLNAAIKLVEDKDPALRCMLIYSLYKEGYTELAERNILEIASELIPLKPPYQEVAKIYGEILYDQARFEEASSIFTSLAESCPSMVHIRYAVAACQLQEKIQRLTRRMELYHPDQDERLKIEKYIQGFLDLLSLIGRTKWHTTWNDKQRLHLPQHLEANLKQNRS
ncbi:tetratricopeptide repeat protein [Paenibacillus sp. D2_2]|uniref:tetratricopeptide repeat protein n=1 Tax=Paenibacillus sp. D2_2 TaxID=3073092 RepID=UPI0028159604|nr:tetratricopeptide repeat protein [Paenibacillus sp. D2_2]WMT42636.1 tetratricopeptide repeat protein [Paenibacillus sp. D2_2]